MMPGMKPGFWLPLIAALAVVWLGTWGVRAWIESRRPTVQSVERMAADLNLAGLSADARRAKLDRLARELNGLTYEERQRLRGAGGRPEWAEQMTEEERLRFAEQTLPAGMKQLVEALNRMPREERQKLVNRAIEDMAKNDASTDPEVQARRERMNSEQGRRIADLGLRTYLEESSAETKMDVAPLIEALQERMKDRP
jgi:hypothetical protein